MISPKLPIIYCKVCGGHILYCATDEEGNTVDPIWETNNRLHTRCAKKAEEALKRKEDEEFEKIVANFLKNNPRESQ